MNIGKLNIESLNVQSLNIEEPIVWHSFPIHHIPYSPIEHITQEQMEEEQFSMRCAEMNETMRRYPNRYDSFWKYLCLYRDRHLYQRVVCTTLHRMRCERMREVREEHHQTLFIAQGTHTDRTHTKRRMTRVQMSVWSVYPKIQKSWRIGNKTENRTTLQKERTSVHPKIQWNSPKRIARIRKIFSERFARARKRNIILLTLLSAWKASYFSWHDSTSGIHTKPHLWTKRKRTLLVGLMSCLGWKRTILWSFR
jgi:hypothetical protein